MRRIAGTDEEERERREMGWERRERGKQGGSRSPSSIMQTNLAN